MILGMTVPTFTLFHVALSLIGIVSGLVAVIGMVAGRLPVAWTAIFLASTIATSVTGFLFPVVGFDPPRIIGVLSLVVLAVALFALYARRLSGIWRLAYVGAAVLSLYLNVFVAVVQAFQKVSFLQPLAPTQSEPPFLAAQVVVLVLIVALGIVAALRFRSPARAFS